MQSKNGLKLKVIKTEVTFCNKLSLNSFDDIQTKIKELFDDTGYVVAYLDYKVIIGKFKDNKLIFYNGEIFEPKYLQKLRVFNENKELYLWEISENEFKGRLRTDNQGKEEDIVEAEQILWGTMVESLDNGWSRIYEKRGAELVVPFDNLVIDDHEKRIKIRTKNYIDYNELGQAGYVDSRFVSFINEDGNILGGE